MTEPVATVDGHAFERTAIEGWFAKGNDKSPVTHTKLDDVRVVPNLPLRKLIKTFLETHQVSPFPPLFPFSFSTFLPAAQTGVLEFSVKFLSLPRFN
jgi:hypothetical protein